MMRHTLHDMALHSTAGADAGGAGGLFGLSLCAAAGGLDLGLMLCKRHHKLVEGVFLELEGVALETETPHLWFCSVLLEWQMATCSLLKQFYQVSPCRN
jgi:hypothetical protein